MFPDELLAQSAHLLETCRKAGRTISVAESCTGGLLSGVLTEIAGSSDVFERGFITYSNAAKRDLLGVPGDLIADYGAVSEQVARAMAEGALTYAQTDMTASVTGVAGPGGGSPMKPVGHVHFAAARKGHPTLHEVRDFGDQGRGTIRLLSVGVALALMQMQAERA
ncbi:Putative competence-damage inducible protein [Alphaproteobacteria bacterium SO-S41]|nr:Putative competence-damage inducible protein [Alphaproteobacteria bacterium SO-S41]